MNVDRIVSVGARSAVGNNALQCALAARAGKLEPRATHLHDKRRVPVGACLAAGISAFTHGYPRIVALSSRALSEAMTDLSRDPLPLVLALPEPGRPDDDPRFERHILRDIEEKSGVSLDGDRSMVVRHGHAGMAHALVSARRRLDDGAPAVIVGGADSYYHPDVLAWLDEECRLHSRDALDGFVPGEGAAFWVITRQTSDVWPAAIAGLRACRTGSERDGNGVNLGTTMTDLVAGLAHHWVVTDENGERHRGREWRATMMRWNIDPRVLVRGAELFGDVGAASGALFGTYAACAFRHGFSRAHSVLLALHSEGEERGVIQLEGVDAD